MRSTYGDLTRGTEASLEASRAKSSVARVEEGRVRLLARVRRPPPPDLQQVGIRKYYSASRVIKSEEQHKREERIRSTHRITQTTARPSRNLHTFGSPDRAPSRRKSILRSLLWSRDRSRGSSLRRGVWRVGRVGGTMRSMEEEVREVR